MSTIKYKAFVSVMELGSLTKAGKVLGYSQPGISKIIESLEEELAMPLFIRKGSSLTPTENSRQLYAYCKNILKAEDELFNAANALKGLITGSLHIAALNSMIVDFVPRVIKSYAGAYPIIQMALDELSYANIIQSLKAGAIDVGFTSQFKEKRIEFIPLFKDPIRLIVNKEHPFASYDRISISALNNCSFIALPHGGDDLITAVRKQKSFAPIANYTVHSDAAAVAMVSGNLGVYIISEMQCQSLPENVVKLEFEEDVFRIMGMGIVSQRNASPALKEMIRIAKMQAESMPPLP